jgi:non-homologous end joining protein Ku
MAAAAKKGAIQFGLVHIPVNLYATISEGGASFKHLHRDSNKKLREDTGQEVMSLLLAYQ